MLDATQFRLVTVGAVPAGHLVAFEYHGPVAHVAVRIIMPNREGEDDAGALVLQPIEVAPGRAQITAFDDMGSTPCIDLGPCAIRIPARDLEDVTRGDRQWPGDLLVGSGGAGITATFGSRRMDRCVWSVTSGAPMDVRPPFRRFARWEIGIWRGDAFQPVATFLDREA